jgi:hypothetical protein
VERRAPEHCRPRHTTPHRTCARPSAGVSSCRCLAAATAAAAFSDPDNGPGGREGENKKVTVFHRYPAHGSGGGRKFSAPLLLWLPPSQTYDPQLHIRKLGGSSSSKQLFGSGGGRLLGGSSETEYAVNEDAPIWQHVAGMLKPFKAPAALCQQPLAPTQAAAEADDGSGGLDADVAQQQEQQPAGAADSAEQQQQQEQPAASVGPADVSMAAVSAPHPSSPRQQPSPEPCCTSQPAGAAAAAAGVCAAAGGGVVSRGGAWGSDGGAADQTNNKAASEAGDNNSEGEWGSDMAGEPVPPADPLYVWGEVRWRVSFSVSGTHTWSYGGPALCRCCTKARFCTIGLLCNQLWLRANECP